MAKKLIRATKPRPSKEERTIISLEKVLDKRLSTKANEIKSLEKRIDSLLKKLDEVNIVYGTYLELYTNINSMTKYEIIHNPIILSFLMKNQIKMMKLSDDQLQWEHWPFDVDQVDDKLNELIFLTPVKKQFRRQMDLFEKYGPICIQRLVFKLNTKIQKIQHEMSVITFDINKKITFERKFINGDFLDIIYDINKGNKDICVTIGTYVKLYKIINPKMVIRCIELMKLINQDRIFDMINTLIYSPETVKTFSENILFYNYTVINPFFRRLIKTYECLINIQTVVDYLFKYKPNSVNPLVYKRFSFQLDFFKKFYKNLWLKCYIKSIPYIGNNIHFSDILINKIYEYIY